MENDPLLFVQGPPVYRHVRKKSRWQEESTSIFPEPVEKVVKKEVVEKVVETNPLMWKRLRFLTTDFAKHVYQPLWFHLKDGQKLCGAVYALQIDSVQIKSPEDEIVTLEIQEIQELWWRGKVLPIRI